MSIIIILLGMALWGGVHSVFASHFVKDMTRGMVGKAGMRLYRLGYNAFSVVSFAPILYLAATLPDEPLYSITAPWSHVMFAGQGVAAAFLLVALLQTDPALLRRVEPVIC
ncbi:MAG: hypothetical protein HND47_17985 [Chloroflexi bacterium]|nr:hypothetical protein [Chloroflexota bacterium]